MSSTLNQIREVIYDELKLDVASGVTVGLTSNGHKSTDEAALLALGDLHPLPGIILMHRRLSKLCSTFLDGLAKHVASDGHIRAAVLQTATSTGRLSYHSPNLQVTSIFFLSKKTEMEREERMF